MHSFSLTSAYNITLFKPCQFLHAREYAFYTDLFLSCFQAFIQFDSAISQFKSAFQFKALPLLPSRCSWDPNGGDTWIIFYIIIVTFEHKISDSDVISLEGSFPPFLYFWNIRVRFVRVLKPLSCMAMIMSSSVII